MSKSRYFVRTVR